MGTCTSLVPCTTSVGHRILAACLWLGKTSHAAKTLAGAQHPGSSPETTFKPDMIGETSTTPPIGWCVFPPRSNGVDGVIASRHCAIASFESAGSIGAAATLFDFPRSASRVASDDVENVFE